MRNTLPSLSFSLDCELIWGISPDLPLYVEKNVSQSQVNLDKIVRMWRQNKSPLYLAFTAATIPKYYDHFPEIKTCYMSKIKSRGYERFLKNNDLLFFKYTSEYSHVNIKIGMHGEFHDFHSERTYEELRDELGRLQNFVRKYPQFSDFYVPPKNLMPSSLNNTKLLKRIFSIIRLPSPGWLYNSKYTKTVRLLRYFDSFFPIHESIMLFNLSKYSLSSLYSHFYYRAQLQSPLLEVHIVRLIIGILILKFLNIPAHLWSHPHNFASQRSIFYFTKVLPVFR